MSHKMLRPFIIKMFVLGYFPIGNFTLCIGSNINYIISSKTLNYILNYVHI